MYVCMFMVGTFSCTKKMIAEGTTAWVCSIRCSKSTSSGNAEPHARYKWRHTHRGRNYDIYIYLWLHGLPRRLLRVKPPIIYYTCLLLLCSTSFKLEGKSDGNKKYREKLRNENCAVKCCHLAQLFVSIIIVSHRPAKTKISLAIAIAIDYTRYPSLYYYGKNTRRTQEYLVYINDLPKAPPLSDREYNHGFDSDLSI